MQLLGELITFFLHLFLFAHSSMNFLSRSKLRLLRRYICWQTWSLLCTCTKLYFATCLTRKASPLSSHSSCCYSVRCDWHDAITIFPRILTFFPKHFLSIMKISTNTNYFSKCFPTHKSFVNLTPPLIIETPEPHLLFPHVILLKLFPRVGRSFC